MIIDVISRVLHVLTAITLVGGSVFMLAVLLPAVKAISEEAHEKLAADIRGRWMRFVHGGIALFLLTGFYNFYVALPKHSGDSLYHMLVGTKILLAFGVFFIASALVGRSQKFEKMRQAKSKWLTIMVLIAVVIVGISGFVKVRGPQTPEAATSTELES